MEWHSRTFFPGIDITNTSPFVTEFLVTMCCGTYFLQKNSTDPMDTECSFLKDKVSLI
jgi:hypothetical protein